MKLVMWKKIQAQDDHLSSPVGSVAKHVLTIKVLKPASYVKNVTCGFILIVLSDDVLSTISRSDIPWECTRCGIPNLSASLFDSIFVDSSLSDSDNNSSKRSSITSCSSSEPGSPYAQSSPSKLPHYPSRCASNLRTLTINFQKIFGKKEELWCLIDAVKPDIIYGCETWLNPNVGNSEIFPPEFNVYRKDRKDGYGGVLLAVHTSLISNQLDIATDAEYIAAKILNDKQSIIIGALYRPPSSKQDYMDALNKAIEDTCISNPTTGVWISGNINLPDIDWATDQVIGHQYPIALNESCLQMMARSGLEQLVDFPTRLDNTLDVVLTNYPSLANRCEGMLGLAIRTLFMLI